MILLVGTEKTQSSGDTVARGSSTDGGEEQEYKNEIEREIEHLEKQAIEDAWFAAREISDY